MRSMVTTGKLRGKTKRRVQTEKYLNECLKRRTMIPHSNGEASERIDGRVYLTTKIRETF